MAHQDVVIADSFPREVAPGVHWTGGCMVFNYEGESIHSHMCTYLVIGTEKSVLVDTGHPSHWEKVAGDLDALLGERPLDYVFPTHTEYPHAGNLPRLLEKYPSAEVVGDIRDFHLFYPQFAERLSARGPGEAINLGGTSLVPVQALLRDLPNTMWAYETRSKIMFVADGFCFLHDHGTDECALLSTERPMPDHKQIAWFNERALFWTRYVGPERAFAQIEQLFAQYPPEMLAPAHGGVISNVDEVLPVIRKEMMGMIRERERRPVVGYSD